MPMSRYLAKVSDQKGRVFANLPIVHQNSYSAQLAADGVSCSMCHQIREDKLGTEESFTAGFVVDTKTAMGDREIFGPYEIDKAGKLSCSLQPSLFLSKPHISRALNYVPPAILSIPMHSTIRER
mgnify:CR=1 FL=1